MLVSLAVSVSLLSLTGLESAGAAATKPDRLAITAVYVTDGSGDHLLPSAAGSFVAPAGKTVKYTVQAQLNNVPTPVSGRTTVYLSENGDGAFGGTPQGSIRSGGTEVTISATYALASSTDRQDYNVTVSADDDTNPSQAPANETGLVPGIKIGNFVKDFNSFNNLAPGFISAGGGPGKKGGGGGTAQVFSSSSTTDPESACTATSAEPTCVIVVADNGLPGFTVLTLGDCDGYAGLSADDCHGLYVSVLGDISAYTQADPLTIIIKCDVTVCGGGGISGYTIFVDKNNDGLDDPSPACLSSDPDSIDPSLGSFCTNYNASHRENAGDAVLHLLVDRDPGSRIH